MRNPFITYGISLIFLFIFAIKMGLSVAPVFISLDKKSVNAVIMQLEHDNDAKKSDSSKEFEKEKKGCDENFTHALIFEAFHQHTSLSLAEESTAYSLTYHPSVPTPPPNRI